MEYIIIVTINQRRKINKEFYQGKKKRYFKIKEEQRKGYNFVITKLNNLVVAFYFYFKIVVNTEESKWIFDIDLRNVFKKF